jgi:hypothetical protein
MIVRKSTLIGLCLASLAALTPSSAVAVTEPYYQPHYCNDAFTYKQEIAEGEKAEQAVYKQMKVLPDSSPISQYVRQIGAKLTAVAPGYKWPYRFHVVDSKEINAFALPGGAIFVNTGTIAAAQNESELAGVMAHEISHVVQRHSTCNQTKQRKSNVGWGLADLLAGVLPGLGGVLAQGGVNMMHNLSFLQMSRTDEKQADLLGTEILAQAGYNPRGLVQMFEIIEKRYGSGGAQFLSDHPNPGNRVEYVDKELAALPVRSNVITNTPEFTRIHDMVLAGKGISGPSGAATVPSAPITRIKNPAASTTMTSFDHQGYTLSYPDNWKLYGDSGSIVTIAPQGGIQAASTTGGSQGNAAQDQVAYGVIVDGFQPDQGASLDQATRQLVANLRQANPQLREIGSAENVLVNQANARSVELENTSPLSTPTQPVKERDWLVTVERPDGEIYYLIFIAPEQDYRALHPTFVNILRSFRLKNTTQ